MVLNGEEVAHPERILPLLKKAPNQLLLPYGGAGDPNRFVRQVFVDMQSPHLLDLRHSNPDHIRTAHKRLHHGKTVISLTAMDTSA